MPASPQYTIILDKFLQCYFALISLLHIAGSAVGFKLDSLLKLSDTRARNNKMTLMHYLCKVAMSEAYDKLLHYTIVCLRIEIVLICLSPCILYELC